MTQIFALDLTRGRAELHLWAAQGWHPVGTVSIPDAAMSTALANLLLPATDQPVVLVLPPEQLTWLSLAPDTPALHALHELPAEPGLDWRLDWQARPDGTRRVCGVPVATLAEADAFLAALGVVPLGCMAAGDPEDAAAIAWFGTAASPLDQGRATDLPPFPTRAPAQDTPLERSRQKALVAARRDPEFLRPLPERDPLPQVAAGRWKRPLQVAGAGLLGVAIVLAGLAWWPAPRTPDPMAGLRQAQIAPEPPVPVRADPAAVAPLVPIALDPTDSAAAPRQDSVPAPPAGPNGPNGQTDSASFFTAAPTLRDRAAPTGLNALTIPGVDPAFRTDALALPPDRTPTPPEIVARSLTAPGPPEQTYVVDERGLIRPSPDGRVSPDGFRVVAGAPPALTRPRPERVETDILQVLRRADLPPDDPLRDLAPRLRPDSLAERFERDRLGGKTETELAALPPASRPASEQETRDTGDATATALAVAAAPRATKRDEKTLEAFKVAAAQTPRQAIVAAEVTRPSAPSPQAASERATQNAGLNLSEINLLGTFGSARNKRALVRLPTGRVINLAVGDRVDGGRVAQIQNGKLSYVKSGRTLTLNMPRG